MRKIEQQMNTAINREIDWKKDNTEVVNIDGVSYVYLFGNKIAEVGDTWMRIFDGGHQTVTTKSRLNALLRGHGIGGEGVFQKNYDWFFRMSDGSVIPFFSGMRLNWMFKFIIHTIMHKSTLDLFSNHEDNRNEIDDAFDSALEERAAELEITVDYYIAEFL